MTMKNFSRLAIAGAVFAIASVAAQAQTMRFSVPFKFHADSQVMPAGEYEVRIDQARHQIRVQSLNGNASGFLNVKTNIDAQGDTQGRLVFRTYGTSYFLHQVKPRANEGVELFTSKAEREVARTSPVRETAVSEGTN